MFKASALALALVLCAGSTFAQTPPSAAAPLSKPGTTKPAADKPASDNSDKNANASCESKAIDKNGKPLSGAAKGSSIKKCEADAKPTAAVAATLTAPTASKPTTDKPTAALCESKAIDKNGKPLSGAAKGASIKKCESDAKSAPSAQSTEVACAAKALSKDGKALAGAAKTASVKKCVADATLAKK